MCPCHPTLSLRRQCPEPRTRLPCAGAVRYVGMRSGRLPCLKGLRRLAESGCHAPKVCAAGGCDFSSVLCRRTLT